MSWSALYVIGAGGHGKVVADVCQRAGLAPLRGFIDESWERIGKQVLGLPVLGNFGWLRKESRTAKVAVALGLGHGQRRREVLQQCSDCGMQVVTAVHPSAVVAQTAQIGTGTVVMAGAAINPDSRIGEGVIVNTGSVIEHDNVIGDFAHLSANSATGGTVSIGPHCHLGLGAVVLPNLRVGAGTIVGAGAAVITDLPDRVVAAGVPARIIRRLDEASA